MSSPVPDPVFLDQRYEIVRRLGAGGFGAVFLVRDTFLRNQLRALKVLRPVRAR